MPIPSDLLNVMGDKADFDLDFLTLLERGKTERVQLLDGTESPGQKRQPYARTYVDIDFDDENDLRECVKLLRWSDERLRARPEQMLAWEWTVTYRDGMRISFGVNWYDRAFYEERKDAFREPGHTRFYKMFGASVDSLKMRHEVLDAEPKSF
ncbi:hypothetical protein ACFVTZ_03920 [Cellulosimicrobium cellulans]|uniref:hypothetical protein n=1 Tax=Cellulosimicrobium cellulans TaxID=1710 RepID=UPI0036E003E4